MIPPLSSRANAFSGRFVLTVRTEVTDRMLVFGDRHLRSILAEYQAHYNRRRPIAAASSDHPIAGPSQERIKCRPALGGLINEYERTA
jgi:putative transposase